MALSKKQLPVRKKRLPVGKRLSGFLERKGIKPKARKKVKGSWFRKPVRPKGEIIYSNPKAVPVPKGEGRRFSMENVEWIAFRLNIHVGQNSNVFHARLKFKGRASPQDVVVKHYAPGIVSIAHPWPREVRQEMERLGVLSVGIQEASKLKKIIERLEASNASHPKMAYFQKRAEDYLVMEPYLKAGKGEKLSKFADGWGTTNIDKIRTLDIRFERGREIFRQAVEQAVFLADAGLIIAQDWGPNSPRIDAINVLKLKNGESKVIIQDVETMRLGNNKNHNLEESLSAMFFTSMYGRRGHLKRAKDIALMEAKKHGFPEKVVEKAAEKALETWAWATRRR